MLSRKSRKLAEFSHFSKENDDIILTELGQTWSLEGIVLDQTWNSVNEKTIEIIFNL